MHAPVLISVYTRLNHLKNCVESLQANELAPQTDLFIVSDAPKFPHHLEAVTKVRNFIQTIQGFRSVTLFAWEENQGSAESIRKARLAIYEKFDTQIFMEDDNVVSPFFLEYMNDALNRYRFDENVFGICGYNFSDEVPEGYPFETYFIDKISAAGWGGWREKYMRFFNGYTLPDFKSKAFKQYVKHAPIPANNLKRMAKQGAIWGDTKISHYLYQEKMVCLFPCLSLVLNTGWDGTGEHCNKNDQWMNMPINTTKPVQSFPEKTEIDPAWARQIQQFFSYPFLGKLKTALFDYKARLKKRF
ncbi:MAG TPA: glycosyltransferase family A protein [Bacteroidales bacterium]|nr:glycosyltransferase family A protein [Bacteroidales bacterium]